MAFSDTFRDLAITHTVDTQRYGEGVRERVTGMLEDLRNDLTSKVQTSGFSEKQKESERFKHIERTIDLATKTIEKKYEKIEKSMKSEMKSLAEVQHRAQVGMVNKAVGADVVNVAFTPKQLEVIAGNTLIEGAPSKDWWAKQANDTRDLFAQEVRKGVLAGESTDEIVARIRGTPTGERRVIDVGKGKKRVIKTYEGGIMNVSNREATALVRTSVQAISNKVAEETYKENKDMIEGVQALATLDSRTTPLCMSRDKGAWNLDTGEPLPTSKVDIRYPGPPPWHYNCRTILIPVTKSFKSLGLKLKKLPESARASMDGQVAGDLTYEEWLKTKPVEFQREVLGDGKHALWKAGKISFRDLVDQTGRPLTLAELQARVDGRGGAELSALEAAKQKEIEEAARKIREEEARRAAIPETHRTIDPRVTGGKFDRPLPPSFGTWKLQELQHNTAGTLLWGEKAPPKEVQVARVNTIIKELAAKSQIFVRVPDNIFSKVLKDGRFKSQFETGKSKGLFDPKFRAEVEANVLGVDPFIEPEQRPIYGYLGDAKSDGNLEASDHYGSVIARMKDTVRPRTTVTANDSLDRAADSTAMPINAPDIDYRIGVQGSWRNLINKELTPEQITASKATHALYMEAQIQQGASISDIEHVAFTGKAPSATTLDELKKRRIDYTVYDSYGKVVDSARFVEESEADKLKRKEEEAKATEEALKKEREEAARLEAANKAARLEMEAKIKAEEAARAEAEARAKEAERMAEIEKRRAEDEKYRAELAAKEAARLAAIAARRAEDERKAAEYRAKQDKLRADEAARLAAEREKRLKEDLAKAEAARIAAEKAEHAYTKAADLVQSVEDGIKQRDEAIKLANEEIGKQILEAYKEQRLLGREGFASKYGSPDQEAYPGLKEATLKRFALLAEKKKIKAEAAEQVHKAIELPPDQRLGKVIKKHSPSIDKTKIVEVNDFLDRVIPKRPMYDDKAEPVVKYKAGRAYYDGEIRVNAKDSAATIIHEYGHWAEEHIKGWKQAANDYLNKRTAGAPIKKLKEIEPKRGYDDDEIAKEGGFFEPYMGKIYRDKSTELISMGLEWMQKDPITFAKKDPDMFKWIVKLIQGQL